jgi:hypothetical protein
MISLFLGKRFFGVVPEHVLRIVPKRKDKNLYAVRYGSMRELSASAELKEYPPKAPLFGSRIFISLCNLQI